jgi:hypothetical protein
MDLIMPYRGERKVNATLFLVKATVDQDAGKFIYELAFHPLDCDGALRDSFAISYYVRTSGFGLHQLSSP